MAGDYRKLIRSLRLQAEASNDSKEQMIMHKLGNIIEIVGSALAENARLRAENERLAAELRERTAV